MLVASVIGVFFYWLSNLVEWSMNIKLVIWLILLLCSIENVLASTKCVANHKAQEFQGKKSEWCGCPRYDFELEGRDVIVVVPEKPLPGNPWVWRPAFFDAFPVIDQCLLDMGFHITYFDTTNEWGRPEALAAGRIFYDVMVNKYGLMPRVVLEGLSRGAYFALRWGQMFPETVACLLLDNPLCDLFELEKNTEWWGDFQKKWGYTQENCPTRDVFFDNAIFHIGELAQNRILILGLSGGMDDVVPYERNMRIVKQVYARYEAPIKVIVRPNAGHHPHGLDNPTVVVDYISRCVYGDVKSLKKRIKVACIGNSITAGVGTTEPSQYAYPAVLQQLLGEHYEVKNFGLSSSTVLRKGTDAGRPFAYLDSEMCRQAIAYEPDIVILKLGGNDSKPDNWQFKEEFIDNYQELIDTFKFLSSLPEIYICLPARARVENPEEIWGINECVIRDEIIPLIKNVAQQKRLVNIDLHNAYEGEESICYHDNIHPTDRGAALLADKIFRAIIMK